MSSGWINVFFVASYCGGTTEWDVYVALNVNWHDKCELFGKWDAEYVEDMMVEDAVWFYFFDENWHGDGKVWRYMEARGK